MRTLALVGIALTAVLAGWIVATPTHAALPNEPVESPALNPPELADVFRRVRVAAAGEGWQKEGWRDPLIDAWLNNLIVEVRTATGDEKRALPVTFANVQPNAQAAQPAAAPVGDVDMIVVNGVQRLVGAPRAPAASAPATAPSTAPLAGAAGGAGGVGGAGGAAGEAPQQQQPVVRRGQQLNNALVVGSGNLDLPHATRSIILADGNARVSFANDCVIIARGAAYVAHGRGNVIIAGHFVHVSHDGQRQPVRNAAGQGFVRGANGMPQMEVSAGGVIVCGGIVDVSHANGTVLAAGKVLRVSHANGCTFVNQPADAAISRQTDSRQAEAPALRVVLPPHPLGERVRVDWLTPQKGAVIRFQDRRYVADMGKPVTDEAGQPIAALKGWTLSFCDQGYALFTDGRDEFGVTVPAPTPGE